MSTIHRLFLLAGLCASASLSAQVTTPTSPVVRKGTSPRQEAPKVSPTMGKPARPLTDLSGSEDEEYTAWSRTRYRLLERSEVANSPLFYPEVTTERQGNLFSLLFRLYASGKIQVRSYQDGLSAWREAEVLPFADFLDRFHIAYTRGRDGQPEVALADIPSALIEGYYLEEESRFDEQTSTFSTRPRALCPLLTGVGDYGQLRLPLFWVSFDELRPYLAGERIALSSANQARRATFADFFDLQIYRGVLLPDRSQQTPPAGDDNATLEAQRTRSQQEERELQQFQASLFTPDSLLHPTQSVKATKAKATKTRASAPKVSRSRDKRLRPASTAQPKATRSATRSVRDRGQ